MVCKHKNLSILNPYEIIRKYHCPDCDQVFMCECERDIGEKYLPHQLEEGSVLNSGKRMAVTKGFQSNVCIKCRGGKPYPYPKAEIRGNTTKIKRYYWREITHLAIRKFCKYSEDNLSMDYFNEGQNNPELMDKFRKEALAEIKEVHKNCPIYEYNEESAIDLIERCNIEVIDLSGEHKHIDGEKKVSIVLDDKLVTSEEFVAAHFARQGFKVLEMESSPYHVLFSVFFWLLIESPLDPEQREVMFGERSIYEMSGEKQMIRTFLPSDFGKSGYYARRVREINSHFELITEGFSGEMTEEDKQRSLLRLFEYWVPCSWKLGQYLWAYKRNDIVAARKILEIIPANYTLKILRYLIEDYWARYCGWPDLLVYNDKTFFFTEVKSSNDKLSQDQKKWIDGNNKFMKIPFMLVKIHKAH